MRADRPKHLVFLFAVTAALACAAAASAQTPAPPLPPPDPAPAELPPPPPAPTEAQPAPAPQPTAPAAYPPYPPAYPPQGYGYQAYGYPPPPAEKKPDAEEARADDVVALSAGTFLYNVLGFGVGIQGGAYVATNTLLEVDALTAVAIFPNVPRSDSVSFGVRQFVTPTFYVKGGVRYRRLRTEEYLFDSEPDGYDEFIEQSDIGLDMALGNRWQWGGFTLGVEWFGVYRPLKTLDANQVLKNHETGLETRTGVSESKIDVTHDLRIAHLQLGGSF